MVVRHKRRRPILFLLRQALGQPLIWLGLLGDNIEGDWRYERDRRNMGEDGTYTVRRVPRDWSDDMEKNARA